MTSMTASASRWRPPAVPPRPRESEAGARRSPPAARRSRPRAPATAAHLAAATASRSARATAAGRPHDDHLGGLRRAPPTSNRSSGSNSERPADHGDATYGTRSRARADAGVASGREAHEVLARDGPGLLRDRPARSPGSSFAPAPRRRRHRAAPGPGTRRTRRSPAPAVAVLAQLLDPPEQEERVERSRGRARKAAPLRQQRRAGQIRPAPISGRVGEREEILAAGALERRVDAVAIDVRQDAVPAPARPGRRPTGACAPLRRRSSAGPRAGRCGPDARRGRARPPVASAAAARPARHRRPAAGFSSVITVSARGRLTTRRWPPCSAMPPFATGPLTTTWPCRSRSSNRSLGRVPRDGEDGPFHGDQERPRLDQPAVLAARRDPERRRCRARRRTARRPCATARSRPRVPGISSKVRPLAEEHLHARGAGLRQVSALQQRAAFDARDARPAAPG